MYSKLSHQNEVVEREVAALPRMSLFSRLRPRQYARHVWLEEERLAFDGDSHGDLLDQVRALIAEHSQPLEPETPPAKPRGLIELLKLIPQFLHSGSPRRRASFLPLD